MPSAKMLLTLPHDLKAALVKEHERTGASQGELVRRALIAYLKPEGKKA